MIRYPGTLFSSTGLIAYWPCDIEALFCLFPLRKIRCRRDSGDSPDGRTIARRSTLSDVSIYQRALSKTLLKLGKKDGFKAVFGGARHTTEQLNLASYKEMVHQPPEPGTRQEYFEELDKELRRGFHLESRPDAQPFMVVLKSFNQKVGLARTDSVIYLDYKEWSHKESEEVMHRWASLRAVLHVRR